MDGISHGAAAKRDGQTGHRGSVSETGAMVNIIGTYRHPHKFLE
jgi:hypothetical protein